jgi:hypothetical protein
MRVFISWSGERSRRVAELLDDWLQCVIQAADPWMSSKDIDRGALWFTEISDQLANTSIGIICLTKENKLKPWILFESGALAKGISSSRVCTFLIDLKPTDIENPLAQFNHTKPDKDGVWELVRTINLSLKEKALKESTLEKVFDTYWKQFEDKFKNIIMATPETEIEETRSENDILLEVLSSVRLLDRKIRRIENEENFKNEREFLNINNNRNISKNLEMIVQDLVKKGLPTEVIEEVLSKEYKASPVLIKNLIEMYQSKYIDIKKG